VPSLATSAAEDGTAEPDIKNWTRHRSAAMVRRYIRDGDLFKSNLASLLGL